MKNNKLFFGFSRIPLLIIVVVIASLTAVSCEMEKRKKEMIPKNTEAELPDVPEVSEPEFDPNGEPSLVRNFYFIFDGSGSMNERLHGQRKIEGAKQAVRRFMEQVPDDVNIGLYVFDKSGDREVVAISQNNQQAFLAAIESIRPGGRTPLAQALEFGADQLKSQRAKQLGYGDYNLIVVTDGIASRIPQAAEYAVDKDIAIYAIGLGIEDDHPLNDQRYVVSYTAASDFDQLTQALVDAVAESPVFDDTEFE